MKAEKKLIYLLIGILFGILAGVGLIGSGALAKTVKEPLGRWYVTTYTVKDNTPAGSRATSSGARATEGVTVAVDYRNPLVPMGSTVHIEGFGKRQVQDYGGFGHYNGGRRAFDVFVHPGEGGLFLRKVWLIRKETKAEKERRIEKQRKRLQKKTFTLVYNKDLAPWQVVTYDGAIGSGTIRLDTNDDMRYQWLDVIKTVEGKRRIIYTGDLMQVQRDPVVYLAEVCEGAVG